MCVCFLVCVSSPKRIHGVKAWETCLCSYICNLLHLVPMLVNRNRSEPIRRGCIIDASRRVADKTCVVLCCVALCYIVLCCVYLCCIVLCCVDKTDFFSSPISGQCQWAGSVNQSARHWSRGGKMSQKQNILFPNTIFASTGGKCHKKTKDHFPRYLYLLP